MAYNVFDHASTDLPNDLHDSLLLFRKLFHKCEDITYLSVMKRILPFCISFKSRPYVIILKEHAFRAGERLQSLGCYYFLRSDKADLALLSMLFLYS